MYNQYKFNKYNKYKSYNYNIIIDIKLIFIIYEYSIS